MEDLPHQGHLHDAQLSPRLKWWTCTLHEGSLAQGEGHDFILLEIRFRMKSALSPLAGNGHFYPKENQWVRLKSSKSCQKSVVAGIVKNTRKGLKCPVVSLACRGRPGFSLYEHVRRRKDITMDIGIIGAGSVAQAF